MAKNSFLEGFLAGLYQSGVGNPAVNEARQAQEQNRQAQQTQLDIKAGESGLIPAPQQPAANRSLVHKIGGFLFPGSNGPQLNTAYMPDPNAPTYGQSGTGEFAQGTKESPLPTGFSPVPKEKGITGLAQQGRKPSPETLLVYDAASGKPRIEKLDYQMKPGEQAMKTTLGDALTKVGAFQSQEARGEFFNTRVGQIGLQAVDDIKKQLDPSSLSRGTVLGAAASSVKRAVNGLALLQEPTVTKTALEATMGDLDSILTQASATVEGRRMLGTSNVYKNIQDFKSFVSSSPDQVSVPPNVVNIYKNILSDLGPIAQNTVKDYVNRTSKLIRGKALNFVTPEQFDSAKQDILDSYDIQKQLGRSTEGGGPIAITSQAEYDKLPAGTPYTWSGVPHVKGGK